jgi:hypothetical protein
MRRFPPLALTVLAMIVVMAIWPIQDRFLTTLLPVWGVATAYGVQRLLDGLPMLARRTALGGAACLAALMVAMNGRARIESVRVGPESQFARGISDMVRWVSSSTSPDEHIMVGWGGAIYLRTGRRTSIPSPEESVLLPSVYASPNRFLAGRILADSVDDVIIWDRILGRAGPALRKLAAACPGLMTEAARDSAAASRELHFYRVRRDVPCLEAFANDENGNVGTNNKNAP